MRVHAVTHPFRRLPAGRDAVETAPLLERRVRNGMMMQRYESHHTDEKQKAMPEEGNRAHTSLGDVLKMHTHSISLSQESVYACIWTKRKIDDI